MNTQIFIFSTIIVTFTIAQAIPVEVSDAVIEIEKQRLVKFPDEDSTSHQDSTGNSSDTKGSKQDEAQRILQEIEKINHALGYVRKQPEQSRLPPILDSSQYLFPKPAMQPFHQQHHQISDMNGGTILIPSIRSVPLDHQYILSNSNSKFIEFHAAPRKLHITKFSDYVFRPNEVVLPTSHGSDEQKHLRTHFVIPIRLYKLKKEEYIRMIAPLEYRVKGYKIVGDVENFYGKNKQKNQAASDVKNKFPTKYHLFFLPREDVLNEDSKQDISQSPEMKLEAKDESLVINSREEKLIGIQRPYKIQTTATSSNSGGGSSTNVTTQIIRKRIVPKPLRENEPIVSEITSNASTNMNINLNSKPVVNKGPNLNPNIFNVKPGVYNIPNIGDVVRPADLKNSTAGNVIKNAFQNIFKFPFRPDNKPDMTTVEPGQLVQMPPKPFFTAQAYQPVQSFYEVIETQQPLKGSDYHWDDEASNSASEDEEDNSTEHQEKQIFGNRHNEEQKTQMEAVKQGGIIIQRLKVRKGGIAIAGPGGVATAGSGGTAIVGPGGYALTHPRSLTIAGPGAKVIAIPSSVDLKDALQSTNLSDQSIPREGKVVATGPTIYYSPATGTGASDDDYPFNIWETVRVQTWPWSNHPDHHSSVKRSPLTASALAAVPRGNLIVGNFPSKPLLIDTFQLLHANKLLQHITPTYNAHFALSSISLPYLSGEVTGKLIRKSRNHSYEQNTEDISISPTSAGVSVAAIGPKINAADKNIADFKSDVRLLEAVQRINTDFVIEEIVPAPGQHILSAAMSEKLVKPIKFLAASPESNKLAPKGTNSAFTASSAGLGVASPKKQLALHKSKRPFLETGEANSEVTVEATGRTATSGNIPKIPFGTYFIPYLSQSQKDHSNTASLILEPHSKAVVGNGGTAISTPISRAFLKQGVPINVYFSPESVAIAGVGGKAHAQADLELDLRSKEPLAFEANTFPYYGGLRGQILQVVRTKDGTDNMFIISPAAPLPSSQPSVVRKSISIGDGQPHSKPPSTTAFAQDFNRIQVAAARLVAIQEIAMRKGSFSAEDNRMYAESLLELGHAAQNLANLQQSGQIKDFSLLLQPDFQVSHKQPLFPAESAAGTESSPGEQKVEEVTEQLLHEEDFLPPNTEDPYEDVSDTVAVTAPKKDASVAEAKPVGLSIAGEGGVASSKPNAVALSGRNGLAVSAPKATAIAGVSAEEAAAFSVYVPNRNHLVIKTVNRLPQHPAYDDYSEDYSDVLSVRSAVTRDAATHNRQPFVISKKTKDAIVSAGSNGSGIGESFIDKWKTMVAEDYAASARSSSQKTKQSLEALYKFSQGAGNRKY